MAEQRFALGAVVATPGALMLLAAAEADPFVLLRRHMGGDWGDVDARDRRANAAALRDGLQLLSSYAAGEGRVWILTEADRSATTILLPDEY